MSKQLYYLLSIDSESLQLAQDSHLPRGGRSGYIQSCMATCCNVFLTRLTGDGHGRTSLLRFREEEDELSASCRLQGLRRKILGLVRQLTRT